MAARLLMRSAGLKDDGSVNGRLYSSKDQRQAITWGSDVGEAFEGRSLATVP